MRTKQNKNKRKREEAVTFWCRGKSGLPESSIGLSETEVKDGERHTQRENNFVFYAERERERILQYKSNSRPVELQLGINIIIQIYILTFTWIEKITKS